MSERIRPTEHVRPRTSPAVVPQGVRGARRPVDLFRATDLLALQSCAGNRAVARLIQREPPTPSAMGAPATTPAVGAPGAPANGDPESKKAWSLGGFLKGTDKVRVKVPTGYNLYSKHAGKNFAWSTSSKTPGASTPNVPLGFGTIPLPPPVGPVLLELSGGVSAYAGGNALIDIDLKDIVLDATAADLSRIGTAAALMLTGMPVLSLGALATLKLKGEASLSALAVASLEAGADANLTGLVNSAAWPLGSLYILGARPAMGKSAFALNVATHAALRAQAPTLVVSLEMSEVDLTNRILAAEAHVPLDRLLSGGLNTLDWPKITQGVSRLAGGPLSFLCASNVSLMELRSRARQLRARDDLQLIIVDYLQLMDARTNAETRQVEVAEISRGLKKLAVELQVPVIAVAQVSRGLEHRADKRPTLSDLKESGAIEADADVVMFLYRDEVYNELSPDQGVAEVIICKNRQGPTGTRKLAFLGHFTKFASMAHQPEPGSTYR